MAELDRVIARHLIDTPGHLDGAEIRFPRKFLGFSGRDFAATIGVAPETVSRREKNGQPMDHGHGHGHEHALRAIAVVRAPIEDYRLFDALRSISRSPEAPRRPPRLRVHAGSWAEAA